MGEEGETVDFESYKEPYVFWNMDDYPIPVDSTDTFDNIAKALDLMGFRCGFMDIILYSENPNCESEEISSSCLPRGACVFKVPDITYYMLRFALYRGPGPINYMVIAKPKRELLRVLHCLKSRRHNVVLIKDECLFTVDSLLNAQLLDGGKPRFKEDYERRFLMCEEESIEIEENVSRTVDFSERIPTVNGAMTAVFWDAEDCPFPLGSTPDEIYHSISSALVERGLNDHIKIWVYLDDDKKKGDVLLGSHKEWASRIHFLPGGDKTSRRIRMLNDILLWVRDSPLSKKLRRTSLVLVADQFEDSAYYTDILQKVSKIPGNLFLVTPTPDINKPETPQWPGLLLDEGVYSFGPTAPSTLDDSGSQEKVKPNAIRKSPTIRTQGLGKVTKQPVAAKEHNTFISRPD